MVWRKALKYGAQYATQKLTRYGVNQAARYAGKAYNWATGKKTGKRSSGNRSRKDVTAQRDSYTKTYRKRETKSFKKFRANVRLALQADQPKCIYQSFEKAEVISISGTALRTGMYLSNLYTDIFNIFKDTYGYSTPESAAPSRIYLKSAVMDLQIRNSSDSVDTFIDVYELNAKRDQSDTTTIVAQFEKAFNELSDVGTTDISYPNVTPFQTSNFLRDWRVVRSKTYYIKRGESIAIQQRRSFNRMINGQDLVEASCKRRITSAYLIIGRAVPVNSATTTGLGVSSINWSAQKTYHYQESLANQSVNQIGQTE